MSYVLWKLKGKILSCEIGKVRGIKAILNAVKLRKLKKIMEWLLGLRSTISNIKEMED
jgi:hypothetical protein